MTRGKNYLYNIQGKEAQKTPGAQTKLHTRTVSNQQVEDFLNCAFTKLESRIRVKFVAEMLQGVGLHAR